MINTLAKIIDDTRCFRQAYEEYVESCKENGWKVIPFEDMPSELRTVILTRAQMIKERVVPLRRSRSQGVSCPDTQHPWSSVMPAKPGVYWFMTSRTGRMRIVEILESGMMSVALNLKTFPGRKRPPEGAWFSGPIRPPDIEDL